MLWPLWLLSPSQSHRLTASDFQLRLCCALLAKTSLVLSSSRHSVWCPSFFWRCPPSFCSSTVLEAFSGACNLSLLPTHPWLPVCPPVRPFGARRYALCQSLPQFNTSPKLTSLFLHLRILPLEADPFCAYTLEVLLGCCCQSYMLITGFFFNLLMWNN